MEDALDIKLSEEDFAAMDPKMLLGIHNKLREDRAALRDQIAHERETSENLKGALQVAVQNLSTLRDQLRVRDAYLSRFAMRLVDLDALEHLGGGDAS